MSEMVERVARAMLSAHDWTQNHDRTESGWDSVSPDWQEVYRAMARAAIEGMREPTEAMLDATGGDCRMWAPGAWNLMIDAALE